MIFVSSMTCLGKNTAKYLLFIMRFEAGKEMQHTECILGTFDVSTDGTLTRKRKSMDKNRIRDFDFEELHSCTMYPPKYCTSF